jgi:hypothetical protein
MRRRLLYQSVKSSGGGGGDESAIFEEGVRLGWVVRVVQTVGVVGRKMNLSLLISYFIDDELVIHTHT